MICDPATSVAFTGHRTYRGEDSSALHAAVEEFYDRGYRTFLSGMAVGFDLAAAEAVVALRAALPGLELVAVVPFAGQELRFSPDDRARYESLLPFADRTVTLAPAYYAGCYARRNDFLVEHACALIAWYDGSASGTRYTLRLAQRRGLAIRNLCTPMPELF